jgi:hypothetical protein
LGFYRIPFSKDTFITEYSISGNGGRDVVLDVRASVDETDGLKYLSRILAAIDTSTTSTVRSLINSGYIPDINTITATLKMFNVLHGERRAESFNLDIFPLTASWDEGTGVGYNEENDLLTTGFANYRFRAAETPWVVSGGAWSSTGNVTATQYFEESEDLSVDITNLFLGWINNTVTNHGFIIKMGNAEESKTGSSSGLNAYNRKSFFGRETNSLKWPRIELNWDNQQRDFRQIFTAGSSAYLYYYNIINGVFVDLSSTGSFPGTVSIEAATALTSTTWNLVDSLSSISAARIETGIYRTYIPSISYSAYAANVKFRDKWILTGSISSVLSAITGSINVISPLNRGFTQNDYNNISITLTNLNDEYLKGGKYNIRMYIVDYSSVPQTLTASATSFTNVISQNAQWRVMTTYNELDMDWQPMNFDSNGNWFIFDTNNYTRNKNYKIDIKFTYKNQDFYFDGNKNGTTFILR